MSEGMKTTQKWSAEDRQAIQDIVGIVDAVEDGIETLLARETK